MEVSRHEFLSKINKVISDLAGPSDPRILSDQILAAGRESKPPGQSPGLGEPTNLKQLEQQTSRASRKGAAVGLFFTSQPQESSGMGEQVTGLN